jgi:hypothetical protein
MEKTRGATKNVDKGLETVYNENCGGSYVPALRGDDYTMEGLP